jgi:hypothetical protein
MEMVIPHDKYQLHASSKTITLLDPYEDVTLERIKSIYDLSQQFEIYNSNTPRKRRAYRQEAGADISVTDGVISYIEDATADSSDVIAIIIDTAVVTATGGGGGSSTTITVDPLNVIYNQTVAASGTLDTIVTSTVNCSKLNVYFSNTGTSTDVEITVKGSPTSDKTLSKIIGTPTQLGASDSNGPVIGEEEIPGYLWFSIVNNDSSNSAIITITVDRYVSSFTQTNTTLFSEQTVTASGSETSEDAYTAVSRRVSVYCEQTGASTSTTFDIYGKSRQSPNITKLLATCNLGSDEQWGCGILQDVIPGSIYVTVSNLDSLNSATATVLVESFT